MGEAKRRKQLDPNFGKSLFFIPRIYSFNNNRHDFINPNVKLDDFDINQPHNITEWQTYFFSKNDESKIVDDNFPSVVAMNLHIKAFNVYINKKHKKGLIKNE